MTDQELLVQTVALMIELSDSPEEAARLIVEMFQKGITEAAENVKAELDPRR